jgi:hypothetical protein
VAVGESATSLADESRSYLHNSDERAVSSIEGSDRGQTSLLPPSIDDDVAHERLGLSERGGSRQ